MVFKFWHESESPGEVKNNGWTHPRSFWFNRLRVEPNNLHWKQVFSWCRYCCSYKRTLRITVESILFPKENQLLQLQHHHAARSIMKEDTTVKGDNIHGYFIKTRYSNQGRFIFSEIRGQVVLTGKGVLKWPGGLSFI